MNNSRHARRFPSGLRGPLGATIGCLLLAFPLVARAGERATAAKQGPQLTVTEPVHDFGTVTQGENLRHAFDIANTGGEVLEITDVRPACGCTSTGDWPHRLKPGEHGSIPITLETSHFVGVITKTVAVSTNDPTHPETELELKAKIWTPVSVLNPTLFFPAASDPSESAICSTTIRNETDTPLRLSHPQSDNPHFRPELKEIIPGKEYELTVTTVPPLGDGTQSGRISLTSSLADLPEISVQAVLTVLPAAQFAPSQFAFTSQKLAAVEKRFAVVTCHRGGPLEVSDLATNAPGVEIVPTRSPDGKQVTIAVTFPAGLELHPSEKYTLHGRTNQSAMPTFEIPIVYTPAE